MIGGRTEGEKKMNSLFAKSFLRFALCTKSLLLRRIAFSIITSVLSFGLLHTCVSCESLYFGENPADI